MARQEQQIADGDRKFNQMESDIYSGAGEDFQRSFFNMTRTERQQYGLRMKSLPVGSTTIVKRKPSAWSKCCKGEAYCYRSISYGSARPKEEHWRCRECGGDCEVQRTKPREKRSS